MNDVDTLMGDLNMMINLIPRLVILKTITKQELNYQIRMRKGLTESWEEEESKHRDEAATRIRDNMTDKEREWILTHKDMVREVLSDDPSPKKDGRGRPRKKKDGGKE